MRLKTVDAEEAGRMLDQAAEDAEYKQGWEEGWSDNDIINSWN